MSERPGFDIQGAGRRAPTQEIQFIGLSPRQTARRGRRHAHADCHSDPRIVGGGICWLLLT